MIEKKTPTELCQFYYKNRHRVTVLHISYCTLEEFTLDDVTGLTKKQNGNTEQGTSFKYNQGSTFVI